MGGHDIRGQKPINRAFVRLGKARKSFKKAANGARGQQAPKANDPKSRAPYGRPLGTAAPQETLDDVRTTLGTPRWRLFGVAFGPKNKVSEVVLRTDASGMALGAFARVNGRWVIVSGDLFARIVDRQFAQLAATKSARLAAATPQTLPVPIAPTPRPLKEGAVPQNQAASLTPSSLSSTSEGSHTTFDTLLRNDHDSAASSRTSLSVAPVTETELMEARWLKYLDIMQRPATFASNIEAIATAQTLGRNLRIITHTDGADGSPRFSVNNIAGTEDPHAAPLTLKLRMHRDPLIPPHYEPLVGPAAAHPLLQTTSLHRDLTDSEALEARDALQSFVRPVPGDGSCFFHSVATLMGDGPTDVLRARASQYRREAVSFLKLHGATFAVPSGFGTFEPLRENFMENLSQTNYEALMEALPDLKPT